MQSRRYKPQLKIAAAICIGVLSSAFTHEGMAQAAQLVRLDIPAQDLSAALTQFGRETGTEIVFAPEAVREKKASAVKGEFDRNRALQLLLEGSGLTYRVTQQGAIVVEPSRVSANASLVGQEMRLAQVARMDSTQQGSSADSAAPRDDQENAKARTSGNAEDKAQEITVTGSRLSRSTTEGPVPVNVYTREDIVRSGQGSVSDFLNTLSEVSMSTTENSPAGGVGQTAVRLRGLPLGSTLVLVNGRRVDSGGSTIYYGGAFDLNSIPSGAVERVEVVPEGSSAIYGSEALAGVVNIILKKDLDGLSINGRYGAASGVDEASTDFAWGKAWSRGSVSLVGSYFTRGTLKDVERDITGNQSLGVQVEQCSPGNVYSTDGSNLPGLGAPSAGVVAGATGAPTLASFTPGQINRCRAYDGRNPIPPADRASVFASGAYQFDSGVELFTEAMYTNQKQELALTRRNLTRTLVPASNAFNPFGRDVLVSYRLAGDEAIADYVGDTDYTRFVLGARGELSSSWDWEVAAWDSRTELSNYSRGTITNTAARTAALASSNPATALNPFTSGQPASDAVLHTIYTDDSLTQLGKIQVANAFIRGTPFVLPSGPISFAIGGEITRTNVAWEYGITTASSFSYDRDAKSGYTELRVPVLGSRSGAQGSEVLALSTAVRYDRYNDFGDHTTPQYALEWRPSESLLLRAAYAESFKAPNLIYLFAPASVGDTCCVTDPQQGGASVPYRSQRQGNPALRPELGESRSVGLIWSPPAAENLTASLTWWELKLTDFGVTLAPQIMVNYESYFPGRVIRNPSTNAIQIVDVSWVNFGELNVAGFDLNLNYSLNTRAGTLTPRVNISQTYKYTAGLTPDAPVTDRVGAADSTAWAPRWKGNVGFGWARGAYSANVAGRYVSSYLDYKDLGPTTRELGDFWLFDVSGRYELGQTIGRKFPALSEAFIQLGAVNVLNSLPEYSSMNFGLQGYDTSQYDIRGRFVYANLGLSF